MDEPRRFRFRLHTETNADDDQAENSVTQQHEHHQAPDVPQDMDEAAVERIIELTAQRKITWTAHNADRYQSVYRQRAVYLSHSARKLLLKPARGNDVVIDINPSQYARLNDQIGDLHDERVSRHRFETIKHFLD